MVSCLVQSSSSVLQQGALWGRIRPLETATRKDGLISYRERKNDMSSMVKILNFSNNKSTLRNHQNFTRKCYNSIAIGHDSPLTEDDNSTSTTLQNPNRSTLNDDYTVSEKMQPKNGAVLEDTSSMSLWASFVKNVILLWEFTRPYTVIGTVVGITSSSLLAIEALSDLSPRFLLGLIVAWIPTILINTYASAVNQVYDVELDKLNKPFLPIASGAYSLDTGIAITIFSCFLAFAVAYVSKSPPVLFTVLSAFLTSSVYSINLPFLRWKRSSFYTALSIMYMRGLVVPFAFFAHAQKYVLGRPLVYTRPVFFAASFMSTIAICIALLKDLPDVEGDKVHGLNNLTVRIGREKVFYTSNVAIMTAYAGAVIVGLTSPFMFSKLITVFGHCAMATILFFKARSIDLKDNKSTLDFYLFVWKLLYAEYFLIPFVR
ncbi:hypothetical protein AQUCO_11000051v1 [Aquilegia coerulea]|uniref:Homogentisate phytyltransferase n=1 Tax=Aquilegia coerulea TaxID=218851 RepID=A0A2G5C499_AQUCA|nr:hypothetical protein AQUCO_11000051v1 [Aquilegia coerulea]